MKKQILSDLDKPIWAIVTHDKVVVKNKTYQQCVTLYEKWSLNENDATIVTTEAAKRMLTNEKRLNADG